MTTPSKVSTIKHDLKARLWLVEIGRVVPTTVFHCWREKLQSRYSQTRAEIFNLIQYFDQSEGCNFSNA